MNLFQVPQPTMGLMGRLPSSRLQGRNRVPGMPGMDASALLPPPADAIDELMMLRQQEAERVAAERRAQDEAVLASRPRERVSGMRLLDRVLGGQTITEGLDAERARLSAEANQGSLLERRRQILSTITDPRERAIFLASPDDWAKNVGQQFAPQVVSAGSAQVVNGRRTVDQPTYSESGDTIIERSATGGVRPVWTRQTPSIAEQTAQMAAETGRINALNPINVAPGGQLRDPQTGALIAQGADRVFSAADATDLVDERGRAIYQNQRDVPVVSPADAQKAQEALNGNLEMVTRTRGAITRARGQTGRASAGVVSGLIPFNQSRANLDATLDTVRSNLSFAELQKMRANSPTGGALGGIAVRELDLLGSTVAGLSQEQSPEELRKSLDIIDESLARYEAAIRAAQQQGGAAGPRLTPEAARALPPGTRFIGMDGVERVRQ